MWAVWKIGFDGLQLVPRVVVPTVLLLAVLTNGWHGGRPRARRARRRGRDRRAGGWRVAGGGLLVRGNSVTAQQAAGPVTTPVPTGEADGDWRDYGGTLSGRR